MNGAQAHLLLNHLPVIIPLVSAGIMGVGLVLKSATLQKVALSVWIAASLSAVPAYLTGEPAESVVKNYPVADRKLIHQHESAAKKALIAIEVAGVAAIGILYWLCRSRKVPPVAWGLLCFLCLVSLGLMMQAAHRGGLISHEEIRSHEFGVPGS